MRERRRHHGVEETMCEERGGNNSIGCGEENLDEV